jgi:hypothetical protein
VTRTRRVHRLQVEPHPEPTQLVLGLPVGFVLLGTRSRAKGKYVPGGSFTEQRKRVAA